MHDYEPHLAQHQSLRQQLADLRGRFVAGEDAVNGELPGLLRDWLIRHIQKVDRHLGAFLAQRQGKALAS